MRKIRDVLKCLYDQNLSARETARLTGIGRTAITKYRERFIRSGLPWPLGSDIDDLALEAALYPLQLVSPIAGETYIDFAAIHLEMKKKGATLRVLHEEWLAERGGRKLSYSRFCTRYNDYKKSLRISLRQTYVFGELVFVDYAGKTMVVSNPQTGEEQVAQIFIGVLGGSNYTYCEATWTQKLPDWIESHIRMLEYFGGAPKVIVHDNLRSAVTKVSRTSPVINESYLRLCQYYGTHPFAARAYKPKDKAPAELAVQIVERWIIFRLRKQKFLSLADLNRAIRGLLDQLNHKPFQKLPGSRFTAWIESERAALAQLPHERYEVAEWGKTRAGIDYHVIVDDHAYSVPNQHRGMEFDYRLTTTSLELFLSNRHVTLHERSFVKGAQTTLDSHRTPAHHAVAGWTPETSLEWAKTVGPGTEAVISMQLTRLNNHYFGYRGLMAMKRLLHDYGALRLEQVCQYAAKHRVVITEDLRRILAGKLDLLLARDSAALSPTPQPALPAANENVRGASHYLRLLNEEGNSES